MAENGKAWESLRDYTKARILLGRSGTSVPLQADLEFRMAHAFARDAVYSNMESDRLKGEIEKLGQSVLLLQTQASDRAKYLKRPDLGRKLDENSANLVKDNGANCDVAIVLADGLSATALNKNSIPLLELLLPKLKDTGLTVGPISIVEGGRVAVGDEIGEALLAKLVIILIGERPGLSSPDSLGAYLTYRPKRGLTDESRNCVSNIRPHGLVYELAADKIFYLISEALKRKLSGVKLKDNMGKLPS
ncbi:ethanolamine ammonia-lyase subunit EutC [Fulvivirga ligni]|uniref:ethanolamine ammonia-lyase subunit EutC n=1 Tax=Fulvivirga ligni TaxID=2904246 RepID=UPI001F30D93F|nr:ethanolamine ammonia-lyase subunit EutC [Fulvivirga ligni]UII23481.1 ethanolamine ammonia-lyase subunit EutC [Fulvivirga ligni]